MKELIWTKVGEDWVAPINDTTSLILYRGKHMWRVSFLDRKTNIVGTASLRIDTDVEKAKEYISSIIHRLLQPGSMT